jgi:hypothetical protein
MSPVATVPASDTNDLPPKRFPHEELVARFSRCVSKTGVAPGLPIAKTFPSGEELGDWTPLWWVDRDTTGVITDSYRHWLRVHRVTGEGYIVQVGGAGGRTIYGPVPAEGCNGAKANPSGSSKPK